jgi:hypothetical protein
VTSGLAPKPSTIAELKEIGLSLDLVKSTKPYVCQIEQCRKHVKVGEAHYHKVVKKYVPPFVKLKEKK